MEITEVMREPGYIQTSKKERIRCCPLVGSQGRWTQVASSWGWNDRLRGKIRKSRAQEMVKKSTLLSKKNIISQQGYYRKVGCLLATGWLQVKKPNLIECNQGIYTVLKNRVKNKDHSVSFNLFLK